MSIPDLFGENVQEARAVINSTLTDAIGREEAIYVVGTKIGNHFRRWNHTQLHIAVGIETVLGEIVPQEVIVHGIVERYRKPFHDFGSRLSLCLPASVMPWPLTFSIAGTVKGIGCEPSPSEIAIGMGASMWAASYSLLSVLSRTTAQPAVFTTSTSRPCFA